MTRRASVGALVRAIPLLAPAVACGAALAAGPALAAFELRDASPAALGAVSMDREPRGFFDEDTGSGFGFAASHASLYDVEGLTSERAGASFASSAVRFDLSHVQVGPPGLREHATRLAVREGGARAIALSLEAERLVLALEGGLPVVAWTLGVGVRGHAPLGAARLEVTIEADRVLRTGDRERLDLFPAVPWSIGLRARGAFLEVADRWEGDGRTSPRLSLEVRVGSALALRFGRGDRPGRTGAAAALRVGRLEVAVGRQDDEYGGTVSSVGVGLVPRRAPDGAPRGGKR